MKTKLLSLFVALIATTALWASNTITYTATEKLQEVTDDWDLDWTCGLHTNAFNVTITSHEFSNGIGTITFTGDITTIGESAFYGCSSLTSVTIPNSVTTIGESAFYGCSSLTSVTIPNSVTKIEWLAFDGCSSLISVVWNAKKCDNFWYDTNPFRSIKHQIISFVFGNEVEIIPSSLCLDMSKLTSVTIPNSVTTIGESAFCDCSGLTSVSIGNSVTTIGESAFYGCSSLTSVTIPNSVTKIESSAFSRCDNIKSVTWNAKNSNSWNFGSKVETFVLGDSVKVIPANLCKGMNKLTTITIPNSVTTIGSSAFSGCSGLTSVTIPNSVTTIGRDAFEGCSSLISVVWNAKKCDEFGYDTNPFCSIKHQIISFVFGNEVEIIPSSLCLDMSKLTSVTIPNSVTTIGDRAFYRCSSLESATIGNSVITIGEEAFSGSGLISVTIGNSVTTIRRYAFSGCSGLTKTNYTGTIAQWCKIKFSSYESNPIANSHNIFINNEEVKDLVIPEGVDTIGDYAFYNCSSLTSISIPNSVTAIGKWAFEKCTGLTSVTFAEDSKLQTIGNYAFRGCSGLTSITIPNSVTTIGESAFESCSGLTSVTIPNSVTTIGEYAFENCSGLTSVTIPNSVTTIGDGAFYGCSCDVFMEATTPPSVQYNSFGWDIQNIYIPCGTMEAYQTAWQDYASRIKYAPYPSYVITKKSENGTIKTTTTDFTICDEPLVICTAKPDRGCFFVRWADGNTDNPRTIELIQDTTLEAIFDYQLTDKCGKDSALTWTFDKSTMALNITGTGALSENYTYGTFIESLTINNEITSIGQDAFYGCNNLKNVIIGSSVKVLEEYAFYGCSAIKTITCYSQRPPTVNNYALYGLDYGTIVYVPADYLNTYKMHDAWGLYDVRPIGAKNVETTEVTTSTTSNDVTITWPITDGTDTYTLTITKNGEVVCVLTFNGNGQLTNIAFAAPGHNGTRQAPAATLTAQGYQFTVTGLNPGTTYDYSVTATDASGKTLAEHKGNFSTTGGESDLQNVRNGEKASKYFHNGNLIIERNGVKYTATGQKVR